MDSGREIFATVQVINGEIVVDLGNTTKYEVIKTKNGIT